ncbi:MAG: MOSC domain-containing protein [Micromonosporaceae bacterium]|nr:MOSC domain-containing protein [Micromonosporaceae bacterium]
MADGVIHQLNTSQGGVPKLPVPSATIDELGVVGDRQDEPEPMHGGPLKALCLFSLEVIEKFAADGHPIAAGSAGENVTVRGLDWSQVVPGARLRLGDQVQIEITSYASPCKKQTRWFSDGNFARLNARVNPGNSRAYAKVLRGGTVQPGDPVRFEQPDPTGSQ